MIPDAPTSMKAFIVDRYGGADHAAGNRDYTLLILPGANHLMLEAKVGSNSEMPSLRRFVPDYAVTIRDWLAKRRR